jgi:hypothetical protein
MPTPPGLSLAALDIINSSLRLIGVLATGEQPQGDEPYDALNILNQMLDTWDADRLTVYTIIRNVLPLIPAQASYKLGLGSPDFGGIIPRPTKIDYITIFNLGNPLQPLELPIGMLDDKQFAAIPVKNIPSALPQAVYPDYGFPFNTLTYWPVPSVVVNTGIYTWNPISKFMDLVTQFQFPPAYLKAIRFNLAMDLAPEFGVAQIDPNVANQAMTSLAMLKSINLPKPIVALDRALVEPKGGQYNWLTDTPAGRSY